MERRTITAENIDEIKRRINYLCEHFNIKGDFKNIKIGKKYIIIEYPEEQLMDGYNTVEDFLTYTEDITTLREVDNSTARTDTIRQTIVFTDDYKFSCRCKGSFRIETDEYSVFFVNGPFYIGMIASKNHIYNKEWHIYPCSSYKAVEIRYKNKENKLTPDEEDKLIKEFLFAASSRLSLPIKIGHYLNVNKNIEDELKNLFILSLTEIDKMIASYDVSDKLLPYSPAMDMYIDSLSIDNPEIRFLYFYKIIEYFSPIVAKRNAYESLNQKLDTLPVTKRNYQYLESIFALTRKYDLSVKDKELAHTVISECIDIAELYSYLPESIQKTLKRDVHFQDIAQTDKEQKSKLIKELSSVLYSTRNNFVHAKSNYNVTGEECNPEDLEQLNVFMSKLCYCLIVWNSRQSEGFRI